MKRDSQYQLEEVSYQASHLEHLQSILLKFNAAAAPTKLTIVCYFEEGLKLSIKAKIDQDADQLDSIEDLVTKTVKADAKAGLQPSSYVRKTDHHCFRRNWPAYTTAYKVQIQGSSMKESRAEKLKEKASAPRSKQPETSEKARKEKKKKAQKDKQDRKNFTPASGVNATDTSGGKTQKQKDISQITCYKCDKKGNFTTKCPKPGKDSSKNQCRSWGPPCQ